MCVSMIVFEKNLNNSPVCMVSIPLPTDGGSWHPSNLSSMDYSPVPAYPSFLNNSQSLKNSDWNI